MHNAVIRSVHCTAKLVIQTVFIGLLCAVLLSLATRDVNRKSLALHTRAITCASEAAVKKKAKPRAGYPVYVDGSAMEAAYDKYNAMKLGDLKEVLKVKKQSATGNRTALLERCVAIAAVAKDLEDETTWAEAFADIRASDGIEAAQKLLSRARALKFTMKPNAKEALMDCMTHLDTTRVTAEGPWQPFAALKKLKALYPPVGTTAKPAESRETSKQIWSTRYGPNEDIATIFDQLVHWHHVMGDKNESELWAYRKVAKALRTQYKYERVTSGKALAKEKNNSIGPRSGDKIDEFLKTGKVESLEELKRKALGKEDGDGISTVATHVHTK